MLSRVSKLTKGDSLRANIALILNNARIGSQIAYELANLGKPSFKETIKKITVFGGAVVDINSTITSTKDILYTSNPGKVKIDSGGVGRNIAQVCHQKGKDTVLVANVSDDVYGNVIRADMVKRGMQVTGLGIIKNRSTPVYNATFGNGELIVATADMELAEETMNGLEDHLKNSKFIVVDGNVGIESLRKICESAANAPILFEPTSVSKSRKVFEIGQGIKNVKFITPDRYEAKAMSLMVKEKEEVAVIDGLEEQCEAMSSLLYQFPNVIIKCGEKGCLVGTSRPSSRNCNTGKRSPPEINVTHLSPTRRVNVVNVSGAGDSLVGVVVSSLSDIDYPAFVSHRALLEIVKEGMRAAEMTCEVEGISSDIK